MVSPPGAVYPMWAQCQEWLTIEKIIAPTKTGPVAATAQSHATPRQSDLWLTESAGLEGGRTQGYTTSTPT